MSVVELLSTILEALVQSPALKSFSHTGEGEERQKERQMEQNRNRDRKRQRD